MLQKIQGRKKPHLFTKHLIRVGTLYLILTFLQVITWELPLLIMIIMIRATSDQINKLALGQLSAIMLLPNFNMNWSINSSGIWNDSKYENY